jgi:hypothetical protein
VRESSPDVGGSLADVLPVTAAGNNEAVDLGEVDRMGPRWSRRVPGFAWTPSFSLWERRSYSVSGGAWLPIALDREVVAAARRSAFHWRTGRQGKLPAGEVPNPVTAARVAQRGAWDEAVAANLGREPARVMPWSDFFTVNRDLTDRQKKEYWKKSHRWSRWNLSDERQAALRLELAQPLIEAVGAGLLAFFWLAKRDRSRQHKHVCLAVPRPRLLTEPTGRRGRMLHAWDEPAVRWPDGPAYWYWQGVRIWREVAEQPSRLTARYVVKQQNVERRRVLLERLGYERFLADAGASLFQEDDYGRLWKTALQLDDEPVTVVEVVNATQEPDGSYRRYFLRVPPNTRSAREAVAWTFGFDSPRQYEIAVQT